MTVLMCVDRIYYFDCHSTRPTLLESATFYESRAGRDDAENTKTKTNNRNLAF